jgi:hypothetical protein
MRYVLCSVLCALSAGAISIHASAMCYTILDAKGAVVLRSSVPPIDLSKTTSDAMQEKFPGKSLPATRRAAQTLICFRHVCHFSTLRQQTY